MQDESISRWSADAAVQRGADYDRRWAHMEAAGVSVHGEADFVCRLGPASVLDAGCGTGRVAIELAARGFDAVGVDLDRPMLDEARRKAPELQWILGDLVDVDAGGGFDLVLLAGNLMIFLAPGTEGTVIANMAGHLQPDGLLVAGFQTGGDRLAVEAYDEHCRATGLSLLARWATWDRSPFAGGDYAVSVHRLG